MPRTSPRSADLTPWIPPRITNPRVERQMRGQEHGFKFKDGYPVFNAIRRVIRQDVTGTGDCTYKFKPGRLRRSGWLGVRMKTTWNQQLDVHHTEPIMLDAAACARWWEIAMPRACFSSTTAAINAMVELPGDDEGREPRVRNVS